MAGNLHAQAWAANQAPLTLKKKKLGKRESIYRGNFKYTKNCHDWITEKPHFQAKENLQAKENHCNMEN